MDLGARSSEGWDAILVFGEDGDPDRRLAGLSIAGRAAAEAIAGGATDLSIRASRDLGPATLDDLVRVCGDVPLPIGDVFSDPGRVEVDCRRFLARAADLSAFVRSGRPSLVFDDAVLARSGASEGSAMIANDAIDLRDPRGAVRKILLATGKPGDGPVSKWLNRPISRALSTPLLRIPGVRPVHASAATALVALLMFGSLVAGGEQGLVAGAILYQIASILDGVDGELARATFRTSRAGAMLDTLIDAATNILFIGAFAANLGSGGDFEVAVLAGWGFTLFVIGLSLIAWRSARAGGPFSLDFVKHHYAARFGGLFVPALIRFLTIVSSRDFYAFLFMVLVLLGFPMGVLYLFALAATVWLPFVLVSTLVTSRFAGAVGPSSEVPEKA